MGYKKKRKSKVWSCNEGCDLSTGVICPHLESLISDKPGKPSFEGSHRLVDKPIDSFYYSSGAGFIIPEGITSGRYETQFRRKVEKAGLTEIQVDILVNRFIYNENLREISESLGIPSIATVHKLLTNALDKIKTKVVK